MQLSLFEEELSVIPIKAPKKTQLEYENDVKGIGLSFERHCLILAHGTTDPFWPDGANANLVRNHIISYKRKLGEFNKNYGLPLPDAYFFAIPEEVCNDYMAPGSKAAKHRI